MPKYDMIIIGAGAAGLTAAIYSTRRRLSTLVLTGDMGGQTATTMDIENYPGVDFATGPDLMNDFAAQARKFGAEIVIDPAAEINKHTDDGFTVTTIGGKQYHGSAIILAAGKAHRHLDVPGEEQFKNRGVVYCATCDAPLFEGKTVMVVGGGSAAFDAALLLAKIANHVYLVHRRDEFKAEAILIERAQEDPKIEFITHATVKNIKGGTFVEKVTLDTLEGERELMVEGVFVEIGQIVDSRFAAQLVELNESGEVIIDTNNQTTQPGIFAAGDMTSVPFKQTVISAGEGAKAALSAYNFLMGRRPGAKFADQGYVK